MWTLMEPSWKLAVALAPLTDPVAREVMFPFSLSARISETSSWRNEASSGSRRVVVARAGAGFRRSSGRSRRAAATWLRARLHQRQSVSELASRCVRGTHQGDKEEERAARGGREAARKAAGGHVVGGRAESAAVGVCTRPSEVGQARLSARRPRQSRSSCGQRSPAARSLPSKSSRRREGARRGQRAARCREGVAPSRKGLGTKGSREVEARTAFLAEGRRPPACRWTRRSAARHPRPRRTPDVRRASVMPPSARLSPAARLRLHPARGWICSMYTAPGPRPRDPQRESFGNLAGNGRSPL